MAIPYTQNWSAGNSLFTSMDVYSRDDDGVDPVYPEIQAAESVTITSGQLDWNGTYGDHQTSGVWMMGMGSLVSYGDPGFWNGSEGSVECTYTPSALALDSETGSAYTPLIWLTSHWDSVLELSYDNWEECYEVRRSTEEDGYQYVPFLEGDAPVAGVPLTFRIVWRCGTYDGGAELHAADGYLRVYRNESLIYEETDIALYLATWSDPVNHIDGVAFGYYGLLGTLDAITVSDTAEAASGPTGPTGPSGPSGPTAPTTPPPPPPVLPVYVWSKVALPDPAAYYYGYKEPRILSWGDINRALSDDRGFYEGADFSYVAGDTDHLIRGLMAGDLTRYGFVNRMVTMRMIADADRRLLLPPRVIARGVLKSAVPLSPLTVQFNAIDFVTSKFAGTNTNKQIPQRQIGTDFPLAPIETRKLSVPIVYGRTSDEGSAAAPPQLTVVPGTGGHFYDGNWLHGFDHLTSSAAVPTSVVGTVLPGGQLAYDPNVNAEYGVIVSAVDSLGRESDPTPFYYSGPGDGRGNFSRGPIPPLSVPDGTRKIQVTWSPSVGAVKYRVYLGHYYYYTRFLQYIETTGTSCVFTKSPLWGIVPTVDNITPGAHLINYNEFWWYAVMARMSDGLTGLSASSLGMSYPYRRPLKLDWIPVPGALEYVIVRKGIGTSGPGAWDRQWTVPATQDWFTDDMLDTGVTYLDGGLEQPSGVLPCPYIGQALDDQGTAWSAFLVCGHAVKQVDSVFLDGIRVSSGNFGVTWCVPGQRNYTLYFGSGSGTLGRYRDRNGRRYAIIYVRGPNAVTAQAGRLTCNVRGIETQGDGSGTLITDIYDQYQHFLVNFGFQNYQSGAWLTAPTWEPGVPQIDASSFAKCKTIALARVAGGYQGAGVIGNQGEFNTLREWMARWNISANTDCGFNRHSQFFVTTLNDDPVAAAAALEFTQMNDIIAGTFSATPQVDKHFNLCPFAYRRNWRENKWEVENMAVLDTASITNYFEELVAPLTEFWFVRDATTANDVMLRRLALSKDPPVYVVFSTPLIGFNTDLGDLVKVTHSDGMDTGGWTSHILRIQRQALNPNNFSIRLECLDVDRIFVTTTTTARAFRPTILSAADRPQEALNWAGTRSRLRRRA